MYNDECKQPTTFMERGDANPKILEKLNKRKIFLNEELRKLEMLEKFLNDNPNFQEFHDIMRNCNL